MPANLLLSEALFAPCSRSPIADPGLHPSSTQAAPALRPGFAARFLSNGTNRVLARADTFTADSEWFEFRRSGRPFDRPFGGGGAGAPAQPAADEDCGGASAGCSGAGLDSGWYFAADSGGSSGGFRCARNFLADRRRHSRALFSAVRRFRGPITGGAGVHFRLCGLRRGRLPAQAAAAALSHTGGLVFFPWGELAPRPPRPSRKRPAAHGDPSSLGFPLSGPRSSAGLVRFFFGNSVAALAKATVDALAAVNIIQTHCENVFSDRLGTADPLHGSQHSESIRSSA